MPISRTGSIVSSRGLSISKYDTQNPIRPDGGWGWAVVFGSFFISFITDGFSYTTGVLYEKFLEIYGENESVTSMFTALMTGLISVMGPIAAGLAQTYGCRAVTIAGALIATLSMLASIWFDASMYYHTITLGLGLGIGLGLMFLPQVTIVTDWFDKRISLATGLAVGGSGFGMAAFALCSHELLHFYDWHYVMALLAGVMFLCALFALTFVPPPPPKRSIEESSSDVSKPLKSHSWKTFKSAIETSFNFRLLRDGPFLYLILANSFGCIVYYIPFLLTNDRMKRLGFNTRDGALLMVYFGISNGFARTAAGFVGDFRFINRTVLYGCSVFAMGLVVAATTLAQTIETMNLLYVLLGIADGIHACLGTVILVDEFGTERVYNAYGIMLMFDGIASIFGPPLINYLTVYDESYTCSILACAAVLSIAGALCAIFPLLPFKRSTPMLETSASSAVIATHRNNNNNNINIKDNNNHVRRHTLDCLRRNGHINNLFSERTPVQGPIAQ